MIPPHSNDDSDDSLAQPSLETGQVRLDELRQQLLAHPIYEAVRDTATLRVFMQQHVFAVWDFMSLLKRLQRDLTCVAEIWLPPARPDLCRFITEIVLSEECDEDGAGGYLSHFDLYRSAMTEIGADIGPIDRFLERLRHGDSLSAALADTGIEPATRAFVEHTIALVQHGELHEVAAAFFYSREDLIPEMFSRLVGGLAGEGLQIPRFLHYLRRHIEIDGGQHGSLAEQLLATLCGGDASRERRAEQIAAKSLQFRIRLWDGIMRSILNSDRH